MGRKIKHPTTENISFLCKFIKSYQYVSDIIDDINIRTDAVFSSYKVNSLLTEIRDEMENMLTVVEWNTIKFKPFDDFGPEFEVDDVTNNLKISQSYMDSIIEKINEVKTLINGKVSINDTSVSDNET